MKTQHTPGPWQEWPDRRATVNGYPCKIIGNEQASVCFMSTEREPANIANARLVAAAPELLEALQSCADFMQAWANNPKHITENRIRAFNEQAKFARAAIAKAKGAK